MAQGGALPVTSVPPSGPPKICIDKTWQDETATSQFTLGIKFKLALCALGAILLVGAAVGLSVTMALKTKTNSASTSPGPPSPPAFSPPPLPPLPPGKKYSPPPPGKGSPSPSPSPGFPPPPGSSSNVVPTPSGDVPFTVPSGGWVGRLCYRRPSSVMPLLTCRPKSGHGLALSLNNLTLMCLLSSRLDCAVVGRV